MGRPKGSTRKRALEIVGTLEVTKNIPSWERDLLVSVLITSAVPNPVRVQSASDTQEDDHASR
jgi:hypothetical protein